MGEYQKIIEHTRKNWSDEEIRDVKRTWFEFLLKENSALISEKKECKNCGKFSTTYNYTDKICCFCDNFCQPYFCNPYNRKLTEKYLPEYATYFFGEFSEKYNRLKIQMLKGIPTQKHEKDLIRKVKDYLYKIIRHTGKMEKIRERYGYLSSKEPELCWSLDNDDFWDKNLEEYDTKKMFRKIEEHDCASCLLSYGYKEIYEGRKNEIPPRDEYEKKMKEIISILESKQEELKFRIIIKETFPWRIGIDIYYTMYSDYFEEFHSPELNYYNAFYLLVIPEI